MEIRTNVSLPAHRQDIELFTADGLRLVGEMALPLSGPPTATLVALHPLPTAGGFMDSHIFLKASLRLPALANIAVVRFNTRGTTSPRGTSEGSFGAGEAERFDVDAVMEFVREHNLPNPWLVGWSFGTELALKWGRRHGDVFGFILLSPPLHRTSEQELAAWAGDARPLIALVPENDTFLQPAAAREAFAVIPQLQIVEGKGAKHLWVGERYVRWVLEQLVAALNPAALPLPTQWPDD